MALKELVNGGDKGWTNHVWLGLSVKVPDQEAELEPKKIESDLRDWTQQFLEKGLSNVDADVTGEGADILPAANDWDENPLFVRYQSEYFFEREEASIHKNRKFSIWFPVQDILEHHMLGTFKEKYHYLIGDEIMEEYDRLIEVGGVLIRSEEKTVRNLETDGTPVDDFDNYIS